MYNPITGVGSGAAPVVNLTFPYLSKSHVKGSVDGVEVPILWTGASQVTFENPVAGAANWSVFRATPTDPLVDFTNGAVLREADLDIATQQSLFRQEEIEADTGVAQTAAAAAAQSQAAAAASESAAATSEDNAAASALGAANSAAAAATSETGAGNSATAAATARDLAQGYASQPKYGGKINAWPDPFFRHSQIGVNFLGRKRWMSQVAGGVDYSSLSFVPNPRYDGFALRKTGPGVGSLAGPLVRLDEIGATAGDTITLSILVQGTAGRTAKANVSWYSAIGVPGGFTVGNMVNDSGGVGVVLTGSPQRLHLTITVPSSPSIPVAAAILPFSQDMVGAETFDVVAVWGYKGVDTDGPSIPDYLGDDAYLALFDSTREYTGGFEQLFDVSTVINGYQVNSTDGKFAANANSDSVIIPLPDLPAGTRLTISGLPLPSSLGRTYAFYSSKPSVFDGSGTAAAKISGNVINSTLSGGTITVPTGAKYLAFSPRQQTAAAGDFSQVVVRVGSTAATGAVAFRKHVALVDSVPPENTTPRPAYTGGTAMILGDSISAATNVNSGSYLYPDNYSARWEDYGIPLIQPDALYCYAVSGAEFASAAGLTTYQKFENQVTLALAQGVVPRWLMVAMGTNDKATNSAALGTYAAAMAKSLTFDGTHTGTVSATTLDVTISMDAMRLGLARLRDKFATTTFFCALPIQRVGITVDDMRAWADEITKMAHAYGCIVIDQLGESGILQEFEPGRDTADGIHPQVPADTSNSGMRKQGWFLAGKIMAGLAGQDVPHAF